MPSPLPLPSGVVSCDRLCTESLGVRRRDVERVEVARRNVTARSLRSAPPPSVVTTSLTLHKLGTPKQI